MLKENWSGCSCRNKKNSISLILKSIKFDKSIKGKYLCACVKLTNFEKLALEVKVKSLEIIKERKKSLLYSPHKKKKIEIAISGNQIKELDVLIVRWRNPKKDTTKYKQPKSKFWSINVWGSKGADEALEM